MKITVSHYGTFRKLGQSTDLDISGPTTIGLIRTALIAQLGEQNRLLIEDSAIASDTEILPDEFIIDSDCALSVLPPVCGG